jgi:hypothetical protein
MTNKEFDKISKQKCIVIHPNSNIVILEDLSVWEIQNYDQDFVDEDTKETVTIKLNDFVKLPMKADINFEEYYRDNPDYSIATQRYDRVPISIDTPDETPTWVY